MRVQKDRIVGERNGTEKIKLMLHLPRVEHSSLSQRSLKEYKNEFEHGKRTKDNDTK